MQAAQLSSLRPELLEQLRDAYAGHDVVVTGGASFIGSHLVDALLELGANVVVADDFSSGKRENIADHEAVSVFELDLRDRASAIRAVSGADVVFHLAAIHGGRGFIETQQRQILDNLTIDNNVFFAASEGAVDLVVHASSACAYPIGLQEHEKSRNLLREDQATMNSPDGSFPDGVYGWTKLIGEYQLETTCEGSDMRGRSARIFTAYGERENESHAAIALIAKALLRMDPFPIWGSGEQTRNFTYVGDTVTGLLLLGGDPRSMSFDAVNVGTSEHIRVIDFVKAIMDTMAWSPNEYDFQTDKPQGVASRASDNEKILNAFGWEPGVSVQDGIARTVAWYEGLEDRPASVEELSRQLMAR